MKNSAKAVANYLLDLAKKEGKKITPLTMQKLVYLAHAWHLALHDKALVVDEYPEAWDYGPVFPSLYHEFKRYTRNEIKEKAKAIEYDDDKGDFFVLTPEFDKNIHVGEIAFTEVIWDHYKNFSVDGLMNIVHEEGSPWAETKKADSRLNAHIEDDLIKEYYKIKMDKL